MDGRYTVSADDVRRVAVPVLRHRIGCNFAATSEGVDSVEIVRRLLEQVAEPSVPKYKARRPAEAPAEPAAPPAAEQDAEKPGAAAKEAEIVQESDSRRPPKAPTS
jgi:Mg-chelatase subunit ChlI